MRQGFKSSISLFRKPTLSASDLTQVAKSIRVYLSSMDTRSTIMADILFRKVKGSADLYAKELSSLLGQLKSPFKKGDKVGSNFHWGEKGNHSFLPPDYAREIAEWLRNQGTNPLSSIRPPFILAAAASQAIP